MKYVVEMGSGAMITRTKFRKDWFRHSQTHRQHGGLVSQLLHFLFQNKESALKYTIRNFKLFEQGFFWFLKNY
jgi:hypothetical protein